MLTRLTLITVFELWLHKDERQRVLGPSTIRLSHEYFESLQKHAIPFNEADFVALALTVTGLDIYAWLAQRLHRIDPRNQRIYSVDGSQGAIWPRLQTDEPF